MVKGHNQGQNERRVVTIEILSFEHNSYFLVRSLQALNDPTPFPNELDCQSWTRYRVAINKLSRGSWAITSCQVLEKFMTRFRLTKKQLNL